MAVRFVVFDIESTGFDRKKDRICSIAALDLKSEKKYYAEVCPAAPMSYGAQKAHGLTMKRLRYKPPWERVGRQFWNWLLALQKPGDHLVLVGHNAARFDIPMLANEIARLKDPPRANGPLYVCDTLAICKEAFPKTVLASKRQAKVYEHLFGEEPSGQHNALGDVEALARIVKHETIRRRVETPKVALGCQLGKQIDWPKNTTV